jgi:hypothetical protein
MNDEQPTNKREESGSRRIRLEDGSVHAYQRRAEHSIVKNGGHMTDLLQTSVPRWKVWLKELLDIGKQLLIVGAVLTWMVEPRAVRWIGSVIDERNANVLRQIQKNQEELEAQRAILIEHLRVSALLQGEYPKREEMERKLKEIQDQIFALRRQTERIER